MQDHGIPEQKTVNRELADIARETGIPLVATNDVHYTLREDARAQDILICIGTGKKVSEGKRMKFEFPEFYFKTGDEMARLFAGMPEAIANTVRIAEACNLEIPVLKPQFPVYEVPQGHTPESYLTELARRGLAERYAPVPAAVEERFDYELSVITSMGFTGYFLIVWDFIHFARENGIDVGPGRGSGVGSLVAYCLRITDIDPLKYGLLFERFLNPERVSMPDFDIDFGHRRRDEVIAYVTQEVRRGQGRPDHHLRDAQGPGGHPRRGPGARRALRRGRRDRQAHSRGAQVGPGQGPGGEPPAGGDREEERPAPRAHRDQPEAGGAAPPRLHARGGHRDRPGAAHPLRAAVPRPEDRAWSRRSTRWTTWRTAAW